MDTHFHVIRFETDELVTNLETLAAFFHVFHFSTLENHSEQFDEPIETVLGIFKKETRRSIDINELAA